MALNESWSIKSRGHICTVTEDQFADGESFYTAIFPDPESGGYLRKDFSIESWEQRDGDKPFSFWQSVYHTPVKDEKVEVTEESPEELLRRLIDEDEEHTENARYILAIMLERKKMIKEADSQAVADGIIRIYEQRKTGDVFIIKDPNIPLSEIESVQQEVTELLENGGRKTNPDSNEVTPPNSINPTTESNSENTEIPQVETPSDQKS